MKFEFFFSELRVLVSIINNIEHLNVDEECYLSFAMDRILNEIIIFYFSSNSHTPWRKHQNNTKTFYRVKFHGPKSFLLENCSSSVGISSVFNNIYWNTRYERWMLIKKLLMRYEVNKMKTKTFSTSGDETSHLSHHFRRFLKIWRNNKIFFAWESCCSRLFHF